MPLLRQKSHELFRIGRHRFIGDLIEQIGVSQFFTPFFQYITKLILDTRGEPDHPREAAVGGQEFLAGDKILTDPRESRRLGAAAH